MFLLWLNYFLINSLFSYSFVYTLGQIFKYFHKIFGKDTKLMPTNILKINLHMWRWFILQWFFWSVVMHTMVIVCDQRCFWSYCWTKSHSIDFSVIEWNIFVNTLINKNVIFLLYRFIFTWRLVLYLYACAVENFEIPFCVSKSRTVLFCDADNRLACYSVFFSSAKKRKTRMSRVN